MRYVWILCVFLLSVCGQVESRTFEQRWNYVRPNMGSDAGVDQFVDILKQSKDVGCTHILFNESRYLRLSDDPEYMARVKKVRDVASELGLTMVPAVYPFGYSGRYLGFNRNLAAGLPVKKMPFVVANGQAMPDVSVAPDLSGLDSMKVGPLQVRPFTHYRIAFFVSEKPERMSRVISVNSPRRRHMRGHPRVVAEDGRFRVTGTFNSLEADSLGLNIQVDGAVEDLSIEPTGLLMVLRRDLTPLVVTSEDGKTVYEEGRDFEPVRDPVIASSEGEMTMDHDAPVIVLTPQSRIKTGQRLLVSFFHAYRVLDEQDIISLEDPAVFDLMERDIQLCLKVWQPNAIFMNYDEIRIGGWEKPHVKPGATLAAHVRKGYEIIKAQVPDATVYTWSDMFTPYHNARPFESREEYYYLTHGNWDGAWEGLPEDVKILNWYAREKEALHFFAERGHEQVLCGYYDARDEERLKRNVSRWMTLSEGIPNVVGMMYTTWQRNYKDMKHFFELVETFENWRGEIKEEE